MKVYTCSSESVLAEYIPFSNPKLKIYEHEDIPCSLFNTLAHDLERLKEKVNINSLANGFCLSTLQNVHPNLSSCSEDINYHFSLFYLSTSLHRVQPENRKFLERIPRLLNKP